MPLTKLGTNPVIDLTDAQPSGKVLIVDPVTNLTYDPEPEPEAYALTPDEIEEAKNFANEIAAKAFEVDSTGAVFRSQDNREIYMRRLIDIAPLNLREEIRDNLVDYFPKRQDPDAHYFGNQPILIEEDAHEDLSTLESYAEQIIRHTPTSRSITEMRYEFYDMIARAPDDWQPQIFDLVAAARPDVFDYSNNHAHISTSDLEIAHAEEVVLAQRGVDPVGEVPSALSEYDQYDSSLDSRSLSEARQV